ncbi:MAG: hypothetical protein GXO15_00085 [Crenarchaeota archaeon]|nr:hypothetical protein [Thermoproteota archaeon]
MRLDKLEARPLRLPYSTRNAKALAARLRRATALSDGGYTVYFIVGGLRETLYACQAERVDVKILYETVDDVLSGLRHRVPLVELRLDECSLRTRWDGSMLRLDPEAVVSCEKCRSVDP